ncbi:hypothetical protein OIA45_47885 (plasmid) [Streptomyces chartreusis]|uniref:hypothetical protein n=1 Tax=Streptomyces chartreusis TaxID=1969 RepID=UPI002F90C52C|nr:hypothetical protein OIA45_47885 [Streptomyces chartreusis]
MFGGSLGQVLARALKARNITACHEGGMGVSHVETELPDGTLLQIWDSAHETCGLPAA